MSHTANCWWPPPLPEECSSRCVRTAEIRGQPAPKDWMRNVYTALSSKRGSYDIEAKSSSDGLKVAPANNLVPSTNTAA